MSKRYQNSGNYLNFTTTSSGDYFYNADATVAVEGISYRFTELRPVVVVQKKPSALVRPTVRTSNKGK